jgi:hypothetical protein
MDEDVPDIDLQIDLGELGLKSKTIKLTLDCSIAEVIDFLKNNFNIKEEIVLCSD